jgi:hypothetical protein
MAVLFEEWCTRKVRFSARHSYSFPWNSKSVRGRSVLASCAVVNSLLCTQKVRSRRCHIESAYTLLAGVVGQ